MKAEIKPKKSRNMMTDLVLYILLWSVLINSSDDMKRVIKSCIFSVFCPKIPHPYFPVKSFDFMYRNEQHKFNQRIWDLLIFSHGHYIPSCVCLFVLRILPYLEFEKCQI